MYNARYKNSSDSISTNYTMKINRVGFVGWRGMVGSVLLERMRTEDDFADIAEPHFFTTSQLGQASPEVGRDLPPLLDAYDLDALANMDAIITCQGGNYTNKIWGDLRARGWHGFWLDSASVLRMHDDATIILDPVNHPVIEKKLTAGCKNFIGGNCTVSLMAMALAGLFKQNLIEWVSAATYQAISGSGAQAMRELLMQMGYLNSQLAEMLSTPDSSILEIDAAAQRAATDNGFPQDAIGAPLAGNLLTWIDRDCGGGVSREEWKGGAEINKILDRGAQPIPIESMCIRIGVLRCHSQAFTIKLHSDLALDEIEGIISGGNEWVSMVANAREDSLSQLSPAVVSNTLDIKIGRLRKLKMGGEYLHAFSVGDQLLWGAAEPLRRMLGILQKH